MKRNDWEFQSPASHVAEAASYQANYHLKRLGWWEDEREKAQAAINEAGLTVRHHPQTGGDRHEVIIDPDLARRLGECDAKIQGHQAKVQEYAQWYSHLKNVGETLTLDHADWVFFFGLKGDEDDE